MYLITKWFGIFLIKDNKIIKKILFSKDEIEISKNLKKIKEKQILDEEKEIIKGKDDIIISEKRLSKIGNYKPEDPFFKKYLINSTEFGFSKVILNKASLLITKDIVNQKLKSDDLQIIQMVNTLDDFIHISNLLSERKECWNEIQFENDKIKPLLNLSSNLDCENKLLEENIDKDMKKIAPNISKIVGTLIGARLISLAGGLEKLAKMPASTIQILGAEKALFRFKKEGGRPPKHGVLFQHQLINKTKRANRGKIARLLATKISIAAKADAFTKKDISNELNQSIKERIKEINSRKI